MTKRALILVDPQLDFMVGGALPVTGGFELLPKWNELMSLPEWDEIVITQDWHPNAHCSFASTHGKNVLDKVELPNGVEQTLWPDHCVQGTKGAEFHPQLNSDECTILIKKGEGPAVDSYSGFFDNARINDTGLHKALQSVGVNEVYVCGLALDVCVAFTAKDALDLGYDTYIILDATASVGDYEDTLEELSEYRNDGNFLRFIKSNQLM